MERSPCKECGERSVTCHQTCERYLGFVERNEAERRERRKEVGVRAYESEKRMSAWSKHVRKETGSGRRKSK